jgi:tRNA pseudouridine13 synthase
MSSLFSFKSKIQDFQVDEMRTWTLQEWGQYFYIHIEKQNKTTMEIVDSLMKIGKLPKKAIGFAGLKDKQGVTKQWFSIDGDIASQCLRQRSRDKHICIWLSDICKILKTGRQDKPLTTKDDLENRFTVILKCNKKQLSMEEREIVRNITWDLITQPFANYFGEQRFGIAGRNVGDAEKILAGIDKRTDGFDRIIKLQALASHIRNDCARKRLKKWSELVDGDFILHDDEIYLYIQDMLFKQSDWHEKKRFFVYADGRNASENKINNPVIMLPVLWYNTLIPPKDTDMGMMFHQIMQTFDIDADSRKLYEELKIFWTMRNLTMTLKKPEWKLQLDDLILKFILPAGSYASVVVAELLEKIDEEVKKWKDEKRVVVAYEDLPQHKDKSKKKTHRKGGGKKL